MQGQFIYKIVNTESGKFYVGSTNNTRERFRTHRNKLRAGKHHCAHLQAAWNKYGEAVFVFHVIETLGPAENLQAAEDVWLQEHVGKEHCYNTGMRSGAPWRGTPKERHPNFGKPKRPEEVARISATLKAYYAEDYTNHPRVGTTHSDETKAKISASKKANPTKAWLGKTRDEETRKKIGDAQRGVKKAVRTYTTEGLEKARANMLRNARAQVPVPFTEVLAKFPQDVKDKYDFSAAVYTGALERITGLVCPEHGEFSQYSAQLRKGRGCPLCGTAGRIAATRVDTQQPM